MVMTRALQMVWAEPRAPGPPHSRWDVDVAPFRIALAMACVLAVSDTQGHKGHAGARHGLRAGGCRGHAADC